MINYFQTIKMALPIQERLFPELKTKWKQVNLAFLHKFTEMKTPIVSDLEKQEKLLEYARIFPDTCTYGGYLEDRDQLWFGKNVPQYHLGVDFNNLPKNTSVHSLTDGIVFHIMKDKDKVNGWGGRVIIKNEDKYILYGHLSHDSLPKIETKVKTGDKIGNIGNSNENGGWFCHLHLQYMTENFVKDYFNDLNVLDGYAYETNEGVLDPMSL